MPLLDGKPQSDVAILFPSAMAAFEPLVLENSSVHRMDLLGWYKACCDLGLQPDIIDLHMIEQGALDGYKALIIPTNTCYLAEVNVKAEEKISAWTAQGGAILHGPEDALMQRCCHIQEKPHEKDSIIYGEGIMIGGDRYCSYEGEETLAAFTKDGEGCVVRTGNIFSFGFLFGAVYTAKIGPHVPPQYKNNAFYPLCTMRKNILKDILERYISVHDFQMGKGIEKAVFQLGSVIVNHTSFPVSVKQMEGKKIFQYPINDDLLLPHSAVAVMAG